MDRVFIGVAGYHLIGEESPQYPRGIGAGLAIRPVAQLSLSVDGAWDLERPDGQSTGRYGGGAELFVRPGNKQVGYPIRGGVVHDVADDSTYVTGGIGILTAKLGFDIGARQQVSGGDELLILASLRVFGPRRIARTNQYRY